ncbi:hypothetical protein D3875_12830 [Deinococcus cavernae]|uniref:Uncharacterized protein n=1 Tax=Deinococcus cavernae TaxID=2320857 RepID=A0A418VC58_9DEIO|nr:hypothetical protein [Deinococcus cavernae]RJF73731.1 hypothetical protein D3875_12830 [Deinococcus cavernae]
MPDDKSKSAGIVEQPVPSDRAPAEGAPDQLPAEDQGKNPNIDPARKDEPAEGGRDEVEGNAERKP